MMISSRPRCVGALLLILGLSFQLAACVSIPDALALRGSGETRFYPIPYEHAWATMIAAIRNQAYTIATKHKPRGEIVVSHTMADTAMDCWMVGVFLSPDARRDRDGTWIEMGVTRSLGYCGVALENPVTILFRSFENELAEQLDAPSAVPR